MSDAEVVIVGGGPAGSSLATRLARAGVRVLLLDRARFPRRKPCGECINPAGVAALRRLGAWERVAALQPRPLAGWRISAEGGTGSFIGRFPPGQVGVAAPRELLDHALLEGAVEAGAEVRDQVRVAALEWEGSRVVGVRTGDGSRIAARLVVGADGLRSVVARRLGLVRRPPRLRKLALTAHVAGLSGMDGELGELRLSRDGCMGIATVAPGIANVTVVMNAALARAAAGARESCFDQALQAYGVAGRRVDEVLATGPFDLPMRGRVADGALLVGDAAGYFDPFTGQGIFRAVRGAELAAGTILTALEAGDCTARRLAPYAAAHTRWFRPGERLQHLVEAFVSRPELLRWVLARLDRRPELADALIGATGDMIPPRMLLRPRLIAQLAI